MNRTSKIVLALLALASLVLSGVVWSQSNRIHQLEREVYPERTTKFEKALPPDHLQRDALDAVSDQHAVNKVDKKSEELVGEIQFRLPAEKSMDSGLCRFSRNDETQLVARLSAMTGTRYHNFGVSCLSDDTIRVSGMAPVVGNERVIYVLRPAPGRTDVWQAFRIAAGNNEMDRLTVLAMTREPR